MVLALLDGADADSGVAFETGYARGLGKPVLGVRTDYRQSQVKGLNLMLAAGASEILCHFSFNEQLDDLAEPDRRASRTPGAEAALKRAAPPAPAPHFLRLLAPADF